MMTTKLVGQLVIINCCLIHASLHQKSDAHEVKDPILDSLRVLQATNGGSPAFSEIANDAYAHLLQICMDSQGQPNPRVTCTAGYTHAANYVAAQLQTLGLVPLGDVDRTTFVQTIPESIDAVYCPSGIQNVIGMVPGFIFPDEYVMYSAHLDGPNNENPQTATTRGNKGVSNAFDNGLAVAVGLAMAKQLMANPPARSIVFLFDDGEEGFSHMGEKLLGQTYSDICQSFRDSDWYSQLYKAVGANRRYSDECPGYIIGASYWVENPTVDLSAVKMMYVIDPLGSPFNTTTNYLGALGGDQTSYGNGATLNDFLDEVWPSDSTVRLFKGPRAAVDGYYSSMDSFQKDYTDLCGHSCVQNGGIPAVWIAQPSFQKYHSGGAVDSVKELFGATLGDGTFPSPLYFSVDNLAAFYMANLDSTVTSLYQLVRNTANTDSVSNLAYNSQKGNSLDELDMQHIITMLESLISESQQLPAPAAEAFRSIATPLLLQARTVSILDLSIDTIQGYAVQISQAAMGLFISGDFFFEGYVEKEAYLDQTYHKNGNAVETEPFPTPQPTSKPVRTVSPSPAPTSKPVRTVSPSPAPTLHPTVYRRPPIRWITATMNPTLTVTSVPTPKPKLTSKPTSPPTTSPTLPDNRQSSPVTGTGALDDYAPSITSMNNSPTVSTPNTETATASDTTSPSSLNMGSSATPSIQLDLDTPVPTNIMSMQPSSSGRYTTLRPSIPVPLAGPSASMGASTTSTFPVHFKSPQPSIPTRDATKEPVVKNPAIAFSSCTNYVKKPIFLALITAVSLGYFV